MLLLFVSMLLSAASTASLEYPHAGVALLPTRKLTLSVARTELAAAAHNGV